MRPATLESQHQLIDCGECGTPINLSLGEHAYRFDDVVLCEPCRYPLTCEYCAERCDRLTEVDDSNKSVGYFSSLKVCDDCLRLSRTRREF